MCHFDFRTDCQGGDIFTGYANGHLLPKAACTFLREPSAGDSLISSSTVLTGLELSRNTTPYRRRHDRRAHPSGAGASPFCQVVEPVSDPVLGSLATPPWAESCCHDATHVDFLVPEAKTTRSSAPGRGEND